MKTMVSYAITILVLMAPFLFGQDRIAILPFRSIGVEAASAETAHLLLRQEVQKTARYRLVSDNQIRQALDSAVCVDLDCAIQIGRQVEAEKVVFGSLNKLGEKIILEYTLADVASEQVLVSDNMTALYLEELDQVIKRVAISIATHTPVEKTAEVGLITDQESRKPASRKAQSSFGIAFGYLYPENGYDGEQRIFVLDFRTFHAMKHFAVSGLLGIRKGFALEIGILYLVSPKDFSPYLGGAVGYHGVMHDENNEENYSPDGQNQKKGGGPGATVSAGLLMFRTYNFHVHVNLDYTLTFNDYNDRGGVVTIGLLF